MAYMTLYLKGRDTRAEREALRDDLADIAAGLGYMASPPNATRGSISDMLEAIVAGEVEVTRRPRRGRPPRPQKGR